MFSSVLNKNLNWEILLIYFFTYFQNCRFKGGVGGGGGEGGGLAREAGSGVFEGFDTPMDTIV